MPIDLPRGSKAYTKAESRLRDFKQGGLCEAVESGGPGRASFAARPTVILFSGQDPCDEWDPLLFLSTAPSGGHGREKKPRVPAVPNEPNWRKGPHP